MNRMLISFALIFSFANSAFASPAADQATNPCRNDAETLCPGVTPGEGRIIKCLRENKDKLSPECKAQHEKMKEAAAEMKDACQSDVQKFCSETPHGRGRVLKCLRKHKDEISEACKTEMKEKKEAHRKMKGS